MIYNYIKIAFRQLWKHRLFSGLNIFGLATSMSVCLLLIMILQDQLSYDKFHADKDSIYRVISSTNPKSYPLRKPQFATAALSVAERIEDDYTFAEHTTRMVLSTGSFRQGEKELSAGEEGFVVDASFLDLFTFGWSEGDPQTALSNPKSIVLTEGLAAKLFPDGDALHQTVEYKDAGLFTVTGIMPDHPRRSHIMFDYLVSFATIDAMTSQERETFSIFSYDDMWRGYVYFKLNPNTPKKEMDQAMAALATDYSNRHPEEHFLLEAQALLDVMPSKDLSNEIGAATPSVVIYFLLSLGLIIITSACFNYMNLSIARSLKRAKEIGIRKVNGAQKRDIILQMLTESMLIAILALGVSVYLLEWLIPAFFKLDPFIEEIVYLTRTPALYLVFLGFSLLVGLIAGLLPALNIASFRPALVMNKFEGIKIFSRVGLRKALITFQFALSLIFILTVIIVLAQQDHILNADLGVNTDNVLNVRMQEEDYEKFAQKIRQLKGVEGISASQMAILTGENASVAVTALDPQDTISLQFNSVSPNYIDNFGMELIAGNNFPSNKNTTGEQFIILNEKAVSRMGFESPDAAIGQIIQMDTSSLSVLGVVKDFNHDNIWFEPIQPYGLRSGGDYARNANIRLTDLEAQNTLAAIRGVWKEISPDKAMVGFFMDQRIYNFKKFFRMGSSIIGFVGFLTIIIGCLGLLGMVVYTVEGKVKEVGIRKVLGASERQLIWRLSKGFMILLGIAILIATPITFLGANFWLQNFFMRINIGPGLLLQGISIILLIGLLTVISQTYFAAKANPVESLRNE